MTRVVCDISVSADGYSAGDNQTEERPFGDGDTSLLHAWMFDTPEENRAELDGILNAKAFIMGRNMFGPIRGDVDRRLAGMVGARAALPRPGVRAHPPPA